MEEDRHLGNDRWQIGDR